MAISLPGHSDHSSGPSLQSLRRLAPGQPGSQIAAHLAPLPAPNHGHWGRGVDMAVTTRGKQVALRIEDRWEGPYQIGTPD